MKNNLLKYREKVRGEGSNINTNLLKINKLFKLLNIEKNKAYPKYLGYALFAKDTLIIVWISSLLFTFTFLYNFFRDKERND